MSGGVLNFEMPVVRDLVAAWDKVVNLDRFDLAWSPEKTSALRFLAILARQDRVQLNSNVQCRKLGQDSANPCMENES